MNEICVLVYVIDLIYFAINIIIKYRIVFPGLWEKFILD